LAKLVNAGVYSVLVIAYSELLMHTVFLQTFKFHAVSDRMRIIVGKITGGQ